MANEREKEAAGRASVKLVRDGDIVGLGTGSTAAFAVRFSGNGCRRAEDPRYTDFHSHPGSSRKTGIPLTTLEEFQEIDITIDGADEVDPELRLIKGGAERC